MPKFQKIELTAHPYTGIDDHRVKIQINVDTKGVFSCQPLPFMAEIIEQLNADLSGIFKNGTKITDNPLKICNPIYDNLIADLKLLLNHYATPDISERLMIAYKVTSDGSFVQDAQNNIHRNGAVLDANNQAWRWFDGLGHDKNAIHLNRGRRDTHSIGFGARVVVETTKRYNNDLTVVSYRFPEKDSALMTPAIENLNAWGGLNGLLQSSPQAYKNNRIELIEYTEQAALFFDEMMWRMSEMSNRLSEFFNNPDHTHLINQGASLLGFSNKD